MGWTTTKIMSRFWVVIIMANILIWTSGCATHQGRSIKTSGFLGDYSQLSKGTGGEAKLVYVNPQTDFKKYDKILLDPIKVYPGVGDTLLGSLSPEDMQKLLNYLDATLRSNLGDNYTFVNEPGPGTMRFRIALTEAKSGRVAIDLASSVLPPAVALNALKTVVTGRGTGVGEASAEFEAQDALTGERLAAAVDKRVGGKYTGQFNKLNKWRATQAAFDYWAERLDTRLAELKSEQ